MKQEQQREYQSECEKERYIIDYFALKEDVKEDALIPDCDFGQLVNLLYMWDERKKPAQDQGLTKIVGEDMICPISGQHCDDECCTVGSECNISGSDIIQPDTPIDPKEDQGVKTLQLTETQIEDAAIDLADYDKHHERNFVMGAKWAIEQFKKP